MKVRERKETYSVIRTAMRIVNSESHVLYNTSCTTKENYYTSWRNIVKETKSDESSKSDNEVRELTTVHIIKKWYIQSN